MRNNNSRQLIYAWLLFVIGSCKPGIEHQLLFEKMAPEHSHITFTNTLVETEQDNVLNYEYFYNGGGVAAADFNNDSLIDLFFTGNQVPNKLYINKGNLVFEDITETALPFEKNARHWHTGVTVVDINNDGWQDLYVSVSASLEDPTRRKNKLFINQGTKEVTFTEQATSYGLDLPTYSTHAAFLDFDKDGDLDVYILNHNVKDFKRFDVEAIRFMRDSLAGHRLLRNTNGKFEDVSVQAGIKGNPIGFGLGIHVADLTNDNWPDIYISNDYLEEDYLYINNKNGTFTDEIKSRTNHISYFSMGNDIADINNDLLPDIFTTDMLPEDNKRQKLLFGPDKYEAYLSMLRGGVHPSFMRNMLQLNNGDGSFSEIGQLAGISNTDWTWSVLVSDFDNDGWKDVFFSNGYLRDYTNMDFMKYYADASIQSGIKVIDIIQKMPSTKTPNYIYKNKGDLTFQNRQKEWNMEELIISNGAVSVDLDNDGDLELISNNLNEPASIFKNLTREKQLGNFIKLTFSGIEAYGAKVKMYAGALHQYREFSPVHGYQSSAWVPIHFGLGERTMIDSIVIEWSTGDVQSHYKVPANQTLSIRKQKGTITTHELIDPLFTKQEFTHVHSQVNLNDFSRQLLLPHMLSYVGPRMAVADINGDGLEDFFIGGGKGQSGKLFVQSKQGIFTIFPQAAIENDKLYTDTDAAFIDIDKDGDKDLYVASGGYEYLPHDLALHNRLYINDGRGNFTKSTGIITDKAYSDNAVQSIDFDKDGDEDLMVGGGCVPHNYPLSNPSRLYKNDGGKLVQVQQAVFDSIGIINDLLIVDVDNDTWFDILAVGEWTGILFFKNNNGNFELAKNLVQNETGLWNRIQSIDIENDGDQDLIIGNLGLNTQYKANTSEPLRMAFGDFDKNGSIDPIISYFIQGIEYPAYSRDELLDQLIPLKKEYTSYELYANTTMHHIIDKLKITPKIHSITNLETVLLINNKGIFTKGVLPIQVQYAPVYAIEAVDLNADTYTDLIVAGNQTHARVRTGNIDANKGIVLLNTGQSGFEYLPQYKSGLDIRGNARDLKIINNSLFVGVNNDSVRWYSLNSKNRIK